MCIGVDEGGGSLGRARDDGRRGAAERPESSAHVFLKKQRQLANFKEQVDCVVLCVVRKIVRDHCVGGRGVGGVRGECKKRRPRSGWEEGILDAQILTIRSKSDTSLDSSFAFRSFHSTPTSAVRCRTYSAPHGEMSAASPSSLKCKQSRAFSGPNTIPNTLITSAKREASGRDAVAEDADAPDGAMRADGGSAANTLLKVA